MMLIFKAMQKPGPCSISEWTQMHNKALWDSQSCRKKGAKPLTFQVASLKGSEIHECLSVLKCV